MPPEVTAALGAIGSLTGVGSLSIALLAHRRATRQDYVDELRSRIGDLRIEYENKITDYEHQLAGAFARINGLQAELQGCKERELEYLRQLAELGMEHLRIMRGSNKG